jgi:hypothetical protein
MAGSQKECSGCWSLKRCGVSLANFRDSRQSWMRIGGCDRLPWNRDEQLLQQVLAYAEPFYFHDVRGIVWHIIIYFIFFLCSLLEYIRP